MDDLKPIVDRIRIFSREVNYPEYPHTLDSLASAISTIGEDLSAVLYALLKERDK